MANQNQNGRNVALPDENRPSWRPQDQSARGRGGDEERDRSWRSRDERDGERDEGRFMSDRDRGERARFGREGRSSSWEEDRDEGYRTAERYGQGQSGYAAGRYAEDRSMQGYQNRNQAYAPYEDRQLSLGVDDRFSGRGGQGYWQDRGGGERMGQRGQGQGGEPGYHGGYTQGAQGYGGYAGPESGGRAQGSEPSGYGPQGLPQGRSGGYGPGGTGGRSGQWGQGHEGVEGSGQQGYGQQGYGSQGQGQRQGMQGRFGGGPGMGGTGGMSGEQRRGMHRGKGPQGYQRSDERIRELVCEALTDDDQVDATSIDVMVKQGEVTLTGTVPDRQTKRMAEDCVERVSGVKDVLNQIRVVDPQHAQSRTSPNPSGNGSGSKSEPEARSEDGKKHRA